MVFAQPTDALRPRTKNALFIAFFFAFILLVMLVGQLFSFEKFIPLLEQYGLPGGNGSGVVMASVLVVAELFALPFLLRMSLSPLMRITSMVCGWIVAAMWLLLALWANLMAHGLTNVGFFGTPVKLPVGWWAVFFALVLIVIAIWSAWGLWPARASEESTRKPLKK